MKRFISICALAALGLAAPVAAQAPAKPKEVTQKEVNAAIRHLGIINGTLASESAPKPLKDAMFRCLFGAPLGAISEGASKVLAANKQLDAAKDRDNVIAIALACGVTPAQLEKMSTGPAKK